MGQLIEFVRWAEQEWPKAVLSELLKMGDLDLDSVIMEKDDRRRLYRSQNWAQSGLLYEGRDGAVPDMLRPVGKKHAHYVMLKSLN